MNPPSTPLSATGRAIALWGVLGILALFAQAVYRLTPLALEPIVSGTLSLWQAVLYFVWVVFNVYTEGYRAFQKRYSPRVVARALHLARNPRFLHVMLAPLFCMSLFHATRRGMTVAWGITIMVVAFILALRHTPQPWRGIVDGGVVLGLSWGFVTTGFYLVRALSGHPPNVPTDVPETT